MDLRLLLRKIAIRKHGFLPRAAGSQIREIFRERSRQYRAKRYSGILGDGFRYI